MVKSFTKERFAPVAKRLGVVTQVNTFWTNFERDSPFDWKILNYKPETSDFWKFQTNLDENDFEIFMDERQVRRFLYQMWDIYRVRKVQ